MNRFVTSITRIALAIAAIGTTSANAAVINPANEQVTINFDFNDVNLNLSSKTSGLGNISLSQGIALSMSGALQKATGNNNASVAVVGAIATKTYNGEGYVKGDTLGTSDGTNRTPAGVALKATDTFIINDNFGMKQKGSTAVTGGQRYDAFTLTFSNFVVTSVQFDYEIFPNAVCQKGSGCAPDISLLVDGAQKWADSATVSTTEHPTKLSTTGLISFAAGTKLSFVDWPAEIGIDNLKITGCYTAVNGKCGVTTVDVPEPLTLALLGAGLVGFGVTRRKNKVV